jgi:hypothetical protein
LKEVYDFNKTITTLRVDDDQKGSGRLKESRRLLKVRNHKKHEEPKDYKGSRKSRIPGNQEVQETHKSQRRLPSLKNPESQESGRLAQYKSQNLGEYLLTLLYSLQQEEERKRKERETPVSKAW